MSKRYSSRLSRRAVRKSEKSLILTLGLVFVILGLFIKIGIPALINLSSFISGNKDTTVKKQSDTFVSAPFLNQTYDATNSARVTITGNALPKETVKLFVNDSEIDSKDTKDDGSFSFDSVRLQAGANTIKAKAENDKQKDSDFSNEITISYNNKQPSLSIDSPSDNQSFNKDQKSINVTGKTDQGNRVTVNGFLAVVDGNGNYSYTLQLQNGDNNIEVVASDDAGNQTKLTRKVRYSS